jgi:hypothetical protein
MREASRPERRATPATTYQAGTTIDWTLYRYGAPYSISNALFERERTIGQACRQAPFGLARGFEAVGDSRSELFGDNGAGSSASRPIVNVDRSQRDVVDNALRLESLFVTDGNAFAARYVASAARLGHHGHPCSVSVLAYVWVRGGETTVTIHR